ncbi:two-component system sensor histidine kinase VicK [Weissella uvarum]|uniref:cell wall metabolism sensor histidine kinase WalK n=1 Tax=Weissella uvarum TaxID=1479233 RepID=UPI00195FC4C0|nr:cell wall metabolism sensor histidine kinase WalK [Weissella uvarum]MBM7617648.1 two-component system sensor histidine kinase VicK [Weissella uvarum]MCM0595997.1 cell wall metabolism sensor histidine kinase WalK [Weissella uvarum]
MQQPKKQKSRKSFFSSIHFKIALVFTLTLLVTLEVVGAFFVKQLERQSLDTVKSQITLKPYATDTLTEALTSSDNHDEVNEKIYKVLNSINNPAISDFTVVDSNGVIRGTNDVNNQDNINRKTTDSNVKAALAGTKYNKSPIEEHAGKRYQVVIRPLVNNRSTDNRIVGVVVVRANLEPTYKSLNNISLIFFSAAFLAILLGLVMSIIISQGLAKPITEINDRTLRIAQGDYSGEIQVRSNDEISQLAENVNILALRIEETTNSIDFERRRLDSVLEYMTDGVIATDRRGSINMINSTAVRDLNLDDGESAIGKSILDVLHIDGKESLRDLVESPHELSLDFSDNQRELYLQAYFSLIQRSSGFVSGIVVVLHDVTEQYRIDAERRQFVSNVSHELRTPLTSVKSYVDALQEGAIDDPQLAHNFLDVIQDETTRMIHMVNDLLELSRMDSGTMQVENEFVNIAELFNYILDRFDMIIANDEQPEKTYSIHREIPKSEIWVELDPSKFTQVIDNIMNNAIKYSPDGGVITAKMDDEQTDVVLSIADQGLGIPNKDVNHVFDRFFRVDKARSRAQGGTGLGLAISKEIIERFGGKIWVESVEGQGSTFFISLPYEPYVIDDEDDWDD